MMHLRERVRLPVALGLVFIVLGCGSSSTSTSPSGSTSASEGTVTVRLTDSPFADAKAVLVTFSEVSAHRSGGGDFSVLSTASRTCDLKKLVGAQDVLGIGALPAGHYTQIRLVVASATLYFDSPASGLACEPSIVAPSGASAPLKIPSGVVRLNREFDVPAGGATTITLDFDGDRSIKDTGSGKFIMTPVIAVVSVQ